MKKVNYVKLKEDLDGLKKKVFSELGEKDSISLKRLQVIKWAVTFVAIGTSWIAINPLSMILLAFCDVLRWGDMHHVGHCGYDKVDGVPAHFKGKKYASGVRRLFDWPEWMHPDDWNYEHNVLHHYYTGEKSDPDLIENNLLLYRRKPKWFKQLLFVYFSLTWKWSYYTPNTFSKGKNLEEPIAPGSGIFKFNRPEVKRLWRENYLPVILFKFIFLPSMFLVISKEAFFIAFINFVLGEVISNFWSFLVVTPNHTGDDIYRYRNRHSSKGEWYHRQIIGSVDFTSPNRFTDMLMFWLNYQITHHIFPNLPHERYRDVTKEVKKICEKHNIPYLEDSVFIRFKKTYDIFVGNAKMPVFKGSGKPKDGGVDMDLDDYGIFSVVADDKNDKGEPIK